MEKLAKLLTLALCMFSLSGCTSVGSYVMSNPDVYLSEAEFIKAKPSDIGFEKHKFCSVSTTQCITYLAAEPYQAADFSPDSSVYYNLHATGNSVENTISHRMTPDTFNRFKGTALLLHGYGGSKEAMMAMAIYFRALGMNVVIPDLFGHGQSKEAFAFAAKEHHILDELLAKLAYAEKPVLLINSDVDSLSPPAYFSSIENEFIEKVTFKTRSHSSLMVFDRNDVDIVETWLIAL